MTTRAAALLAAAAITFIVVAGVVVATMAGASAARPAIQLSTDVITPGRTVTITGTGWTYGMSVDATLCGGDAVSGTVDCATTATATMVATERGLLWSQITGVVPPRPCPCVVLVTGTGATYRRTIPVQVVGAGTAPVRKQQPTLRAAVRLSDLRVVSGTTVGSAFGAGARRTLELRLSNTGSRPVTPVLVGRWGSGASLPNVIAMPAVPPLAAGRSRQVEVAFDLAPFSMGKYQVRVQAQVAGYPHPVRVAATTSQWPIALFACVALVLLAAVVALAAIRRRRPGAVGLE